MKVSVDKSYTYGFFLDEKELRRIYDIMVQQLKRVTEDDNITGQFEAKYKNEVIAKLSSIDEITSETNGDAWEIQSLDMNLYDNKQQFDTQITLKFMKYRYTPISYSISGSDRDWVYITSSQIDERIRSIKKFPLKYHLGSTGCLGPLFGSISILVIATIILTILNLIGPNHVSLSPMIIFTLITIVALLIIGLWTIPYFFPSYNFYWGDYAKTFDKRQNIGRFIILSVIVVIILSILAGIIANYLSAKIGIGH